MPRNVRNFWIELQVDGRATRIQAGPIAKDGGFSLRILMRDKGSIVTALRLDGMAAYDGTLALHTSVGRDVLESLTTHGGDQHIETVR